MPHEARNPDAFDLAAHAAALNASAKATDHMATVLEQAPDKAVHVLDVGMTHGGALVLLWFSLKVLLLWLASKGKP